MKGVEYLKLNVEPINSAPSLEDQKSAWQNRGEESFRKMRNGVVETLKMTCQDSSGEGTSTSSSTSMSPTSSLGTGTPIVEFQNKCFEDLGCFYTGPPFYDEDYRPISKAPLDDVRATFILFTPENPDYRETIEATDESIGDSSFNPELPIKVLIHGYLTELGDDDIRWDMKDEILKEDNYNVIVVNWTKDSQPPYEQAVANIRVVGAQVAKLMNFLIETKDVKPEDIHLIGHSLGAHTAGYAGERIPGLRRITGLDPAGPYFQNVENSVRLDFSDAAFVDVIHTDMSDIEVIEGFGLAEAVGHMDFYPNGGKKQPGCPQWRTSTDDEGNSGIQAVNFTALILLNSLCGHERANELFLESIDNSRCRFLATQCDSYNDFEKDDCSPKDSSAEMGFHAEKIPDIPEKSKFFLKTNEASPFCI